jgi:cytoskeleton protein RodZ
LGKVTGIFGENLRREREMRGVSLEEISAATKIGVRLLEAIEAEDFSKLPGGIFGRSFIRAYARYLGLDEEALLAEYEQMAKSRGEVDIARFAASRPAVATERSSRKVLLAVLASVLLLAAGYELYRHSRQRAGEGTIPSNSALASVAPKKNVPPDKSQSSTSPQGVTPAGSVTSNSPGAEPQTSPGQAAGSTTAGVSQAGGVASPGATTPVSPAAPAANADAALTLQVAATERAWVAVDADGKTILQGVLEPNDVKTLKANRSFDVMTGNAQGIILTLNGETLKPLGRQGEVKSIRLTRASLKNP